MPLDPFEYPAMGQSVAVARAKIILSYGSSHSYLAKNFRVKYEESVVESSE